MRQVSQCDWQVSRPDREVSQSDVDLIIGIHAYFKLSWMVPTFLGKPKPPLPSRAVSGSQASNATWRWNWCSFLNCVRRRFFFVQHLEFFSFPVFLCSLSIIQSFYPVFLYFSLPSVNRDLWWFLHRPTGDSDSCINYWTNGDVPLVGFLGQAMSRLPGHRRFHLDFLWFSGVSSCHIISCS